MFLQLRCLAVAALTSTGKRLHCPKDSARCASSNCNSPGVCAMIARLEDGITTMKTILTPILLLAGSCVAWAQADIDAALTTALSSAGFTGNVQASLESRLGRPVNKQLADLGRLLWF